MSKPGGDPSSGISSVDVLRPTERHPACRQREARPGCRMERENLASDAKGKGASGSNREAESTDAPERGGLPRSSDEAGPERDQLGRVCARALGIACAPAQVDPQIASDSPAPLLQPLHERRDTGLSLRIVRREIHEHADAAHPAALLRARRNRPCRRAAEQRYKIAA